MIYREMDIGSLAERMGQIEDTRDNRGKLHRLVDILVLAVFGILWGFTDFTNMCKELAYHEDDFTKMLGLRHGIPSHDTFSAVFSAIDTGAFLECFADWMSGIVQTSGKHIAIDGKAVRAACDKVHGGRIPYLLNAYNVSDGLCIGQIKLDEKANEIIGIPIILDWLDLGGATVTIDAIGCQREIAQKLVSKGAHYVLAVKGNQPTLHSDILLEMDSRIAEATAAKERARAKAGKTGEAIMPDIDPQFDVYVTYNNGHGRVERRTYCVLNNSGCVDKSLWPSVAGIGYVKRERQVLRRDGNDEIIDEPPTMEVETYILSRGMTAEEFACYARQHWHIENGLHWVLDDYYREDRCTARIGRATENLGLFRKLMFNLSKLDPATAKLSRKAKEIYYRHNPGAVLDLLFKHLPTRF